MWEIWANLLLPKALKSCPKSKKSPNLVTLWLLWIVFTEHSSSFFFLCSKWEASIVHHIFRHLHLMPRQISTKMNLISSAVLLITSYSLAAASNSSKCLQKCLKLCRDFEGEFNQVLHHLPRDFISQTGNGNGEESTQTGSSGEATSVKTVFEEEFSPINKRSFNKLDKYELIWQIVTH